MLQKYGFQGEYYKYLLLVVFLCVWVWSFWNPVNEKNWFLENKAVFITIPIVYLIFIRYIRFSKLSLTLVTFFLLLHIVGAHYTYSSVPVGWTLGELFTHTRTNIYDKVVHFSFGLLIAYPLREFFLRVAQMKGFWGYLVPYMALLTLGVWYEIFEWVTVLQYDSLSGYLFVGGNDPFDTTKDLLSAAVGALISLSFVALLEYMQSTADFKKGIKLSFARDTRSYPAEDAHIHKKLESKKQ